MIVLDLDMLCVVCSMYACIKTNVVGEVMSYRTYNV